MRTSGRHASKALLAVVAIAVGAMVASAAASGASPDGRPRDRQAHIAASDERGERGTRSVGAATGGARTHAALAAAIRQGGAGGGGVDLTGRRDYVEPARLAPGSQPTINAPTDGSTVSGQVAVAASSTAGFVHLAFGSADVTVAVDAGTASHTFDSSGMAGAVAVMAADCSDAAGTDCGAPVSVTVTVSNAAPTLTEPSPRAHVRLSVDVAADSGATAVAFRIDGVEVAFDSAAPFAKVVSTDGLSLGQHDVDAINCSASDLCDDANPSASRMFTVEDRLRPTIARIAPNPFNPDGPDRVSSTSVHYRVDVESVVSLRVQNSSGGTVLGPISLGVRQPGRAYTYRWSGRGTGGATLRGGRYTIHLDTSSNDNASLVGHASRSVTIDTRPARIVGGAASPRRFYPRRDHFKDTTTLRGRLSEAVSSLKVAIRSPGGAVVRTVDAGSRRSGAFRVVWNGRTNGGSVVPAGRYTYRYVTRDRLGNEGQTKSFRIVVSDKRLMRHTWSTVVGAKQSFERNLSGRCSGVYVPTNRGWKGSVGYYSDYECAGIDDDALAAAIHGAHVPRAVRYGSIRVDTYGACSLPEIHDRAALIYIKSNGNLSNVGFALNWRVGWHRGRGVSADNLITPGGQLRWVTGTVDVNWYDVQTYKVSLVYFALR